MISYIRDNYVIIMLLCYALFYYSVMLFYVTLLCPLMLLYYSLLCFSVMRGCFMACWIPPYIHWLNLSTFSQWITFTEGYYEIHWGIFRYIWPWQSIEVFLILNGRSSQTGFHFSDWSTFPLFECCRDSWN